VNIASKTTASDLNV